MKTEQASRPRFKDILVIFANYEHHRSIFLDPATGKRPPAEHSFLFSQVQKAATRGEAFFNQEGIELLGVDPATTPAAPLPSMVLRALCSIDTEEIESRDLKRERCPDGHGFASYSGGMLAGLNKLMQDEISRRGWDKTADSAQLSLYVEPVGTTFSFVVDRPGRTPPFMRGEKRTATYSAPTYRALSFTCSAAKIESDIAACIAFDQEHKKQIGAMLSPYIEAGKIDAAISDAGGFAKRLAKSRSDASPEMAKPDAAPAAPLRRTARL